MAAPGPFAIRSKGNDLWERALQSLDQNTKAKVFPVQSDKRNVLEEILVAVNVNKEYCLKKRWRLTKNGLVLRDLFEKIAVWVNKFKEIGDITVGHDPTHAALPWAAVRVLLQVRVLLNPYDLLGRK